MEDMVGDAFNRPNGTPPMHSLTPGNKVPG
jgi:hypothetical protein